MKTGEVITIKPADITIPPDRLRQLRPEVVDELASSFRQVGQLQPIIVRPGPSGGWVLVAGWHRFMAARQIGLDRIYAVVLDGLTADEAELAEVDENLVRADLSPAERALHIDKRKALYEALHPETKQGKAPGKAGGGKRRMPRLASFAKDTATKTGQSKTKVARDATRGKRVTVLKDTIGTSLDQGDQLDALAKLPASEQRALAARAKAGEKVSATLASKKLRREQREIELGAKIQAMPDTRYGVIYADPPWRFAVYNEETGTDRAADNHYPTMTLEAIKALAVPAADDAVLFLWATVPMLAHALEVMQAWGFTYKSNIVWFKDHIGTGHWFRNQHELLLVGTRGKVPAPAMGDQPNSVLKAKVGEHSVKPEIFYALIEKMYPSLPKIELFARGTPREGWDAWGNEAESAPSPGEPSPPESSPPRRLSIAELEALEPDPGRKLH